MSGEGNLATLTITVVLGSIRRGRSSERAAKLLVERVALAGHQTELIDLRELAIPLYDGEDASEAHDGVTTLRKRMAKADAAIWLTPEYNHGYTSAIKNAIDYLGPELRRRPSVVCGLSSGLIGGARAVEQFKQVLIELHNVPLRESVYFADAGKIFDEDDRLTRPEIAERIDYVVADLAWYARALQWGRENLALPQRRRD